MSDSKNKISKTKLVYSCQRGEECSAPSQQNILLIHGVDDGMWIIWFIQLLDFLL